MNKHGEKVGELQLRKANQWTKCQENCKAEVCDTARWPATHLLSSMHKFFSRNSKKQISIHKTSIHTSNIPSVQPPCPCCKDCTISRSRSTFTWSPMARPHGPDLELGPCSPIKVIFVVSGQCCEPEIIPGLMNT